MIKRYSGVLQNNSPRIRVIRTLEEWISKGRLGSGERLPAELDIAEKLDVSRGTVRTALRHLEKNGLVRSIENGRGRIVAGEEKQKSVNSMGKFFVILSNLAENPAKYAESHAMWSVEAGAIDRCNRMSYHSMVLNTSCLRDGYFSEIVRNSPAGVILSNNMISSADLCRQAASEASRMDIPVVINGDCEGIERFDRVISDHAEGSYLLTKRLISRGCRRILRIWSFSGDVYWLRDRNSGYEKAVSESGIEILPPISIGSLSPRISGDRRNFEDRTRQYAGFLAEHLSSGKGVDAIMLTSDSDVYPAASACRLFNKIPGKDIMLAGYDNTWRECEERQWEEYVPEATVDKRNFQTGEEMINLLMSRMEGRAPSGPQLVRIKPQIVGGGDEK